MASCLVRLLTFSTYVLIQGKGKCVLAMDALFGLPRKMSAGISHRDALHGELFFHNQADVDQFVAESGHRKSKPQATVNMFMYFYFPDISKHIAAGCSV